MSRRVDTQVVVEVDKPYFSGKEAFWNPDGSVYHLGTKPGAVANRLIVVDLDKHAKCVVANFDEVTLEIHSDRLMHTYTGRYRGVMISVVAVGYGAPMMDFLMREASMCCAGPMAVVYMGVCGVLKDSTSTSASASSSSTSSTATSTKNAKQQSDADPTSVVCLASEGACYSFINHHALTEDNQNSQENYNMANKVVPFIHAGPVEGDGELHSRLFDKLQKSSSGPHLVTKGKYCSVESLPSQLQSDDSFLVNNDISGVVSRVGNADFVDCATHQLFYLASRRSVPCKAASCCLGVPLTAQNMEVGYLPEHQEQHHFKSVGGYCMEVLSALEL